MNKLSVIFSLQTRTMFVNSSIKAVAVKYVLEISS